MEFILSGKNILYTITSFSFAYLSYHFFNKIKLIYTSFKYLNSYINTINDNTAIVHDTYIEIPYTHVGSQYKVRLPYNPKLTMHMLNYYVTADTINEDGTISNIDITQQPGVPYLIDAIDLNVNKITAITENNNIYEYIDKIPMYLNNF